MPAWVDDKRCDGCGGHPEPPCLRVCPGDVLVKDFTRDRARLRAPGDCWDCYACVKVCPRNALQVELPYALARRTGELKVIEHGPRGVVWQLRWPDGRVQEIRRVGHFQGAEDATPPLELFLGGGI